MPLDLITTDVIGAVAKLSEPAIKDAYTGLKELLVRKFGPAAPVAAAVNSVEQNPESSARQAVLQEEIAEIKAGKDEELILEAKKVIQQVEGTPGGKEIIRQLIKGNHNIVAGGDIKIGGNYTVGH